MKRLFVILTTLFLLYGCSTVGLVSSEEVFEKTLGQYSEVMTAYAITPTDSEYVYIVSTTDGMIILFHIDKTPPHRVTSFQVLFKFVCGGFKENA